MSAPRGEAMFLRPAEAAALARPVHASDLPCIRGAASCAPCACARDCASRVRTSMTGSRAPRSASSRVSSRFAPCRRRVGASAGSWAARRGRRGEHRASRAQGRQRRWRVRWRQGGRNRSKVLGRKRDAEAFDAELVRRKRTGELAQLEPAKSRSPTSARSGGGCTRSRTSRARPSKSTPSSGTRTSCRGSARCRCAS